MQAYRDQHGIPHARAASVEAAFRAQGHLAALDRGLQMEYVRRKALGTWAEVVGSRALTDDMFSRRVGLAAAARRSYEGLADETKAVFTAYAEGVNDALGGSLAGCDLPEPPRKWEPWHSVAVYLGRHVGMGSMAHKLFRTALLPVAPADVVWRVRSNAREELMVLPTGAVARVDTAGPPPGHGEKVRGWLNGLAEVETVAASADPAAGSNNWVVSGAHTASGRPLLAGDPHRPFETPGPYWQNHVSCDAFDAIGLSFPGVPGFPHFGHNAHVAWGITHGMADDQDLFVENLDRLDTRTELITVRDAEPVRITVHTSARGGVVVQDDTANTGLALRWTGTAEPDRTLDCLLPMLKTASVAELDDVMRGWSVPVDHLMMADVHGAIGYRLRGRVPSRDQANSWAAVPGWDPAYAWRGWVPFDQMPAARDPEEGLLVSANNRPSADPTPYVAHDFAGPARATRILQLLREGVAAPQALDRAAMERIHADVSSLTAREFVASLEHVKAAEGSRVSQLLELLRGWDGTMGLGSVAATVYTEARRELLTTVPLPGSDASHARLLSPQQRTGTLWLSFQALLAGARAGDESMFGAWSDAVGQALDRAAERLTEEIGPDLADWTWGRLHQCRFTALLPGVPAVAGRPVPGDNETVRAAGLHGIETTTASSGSVARYVFDLGDWEASGWVVPEQTDEWYAARLVPMHYDWAVIESAGTPIVLGAAADLEDAAR
ncbi:penicillin acylase family protein [Catenulispora pinisilvae]|uniref:penicillin acylase family protein n=1 Tax=Catenulispora pinisilvae TaxID=2705253 RepID=UPI0018921723|nr:penicillin acylase family protein [Catenulispora pinisilvae]